MFERVTPETNVELAARTAAKAVVDDVFLRLGIDAQSPLEMQKDMAALRELRILLAQTEFKKDLFWVRKSRTTLDSVRFKGVIALLGLAVTSLGAILSVAIKSLIDNLGA